MYEFWRCSFYRRFKKNIMLPTLEGLKKEKLTYSGFLFFGVMITKKGCKLLEYNVRMGDPETQSILPLLQNDIFDIANVSIDNKLDNLELSWKQGYSINVVLASKGYPQKPIVNLPISLANNISAKISNILFRLKTTIYLSKSHSSDK